MCKDCKQHGVKVPPHPADPKGGKKVKPERKGNGKNN